MRRPQPDSRDTSAAGPPRVSAKRRLPRLRSRKARFGALGVLAVGVTGGLLAASALAAPTPPPPQASLKVLLIGDGAADPTTAAWETALTKEGVPYQEVTAANTGTQGSWTVALPALTTGTTGNFNGVVIADSPSEFAPGQLTNLYAYEGQYGVRQLDGNVTGFPAISIGVTSASTGVALDGTTNHLTAAGTTALPGLAGPIAFDVGSFAYPATAGASFTSWLNYNGGAQSLGGVYQHPSTDAQKNVAEAALFFNYNATQAQWRILSPGLINWVTQNTHLGLFRNYVSMNLDDMLNADNLWNTTTHSLDFNAIAAEMTPADIVARLQTGRGSTPSASTGRSTPARAPRTRQRHVADPLLAQLQTADPFNPGKTYAADFGWINHTWDHATLDTGCATSNYIQAEVNQNSAFATATGSGGLGGLGLTADTTGTLNGGYGTFNKNTLVTGEHAGLANLNPGRPGAIDPPNITSATPGGSGTLAAGSYQYALTDQYAPTGGESSASVTTTPIVVAASQAVTLNWGGICKAADYRVYREAAGSNTWSLIATR